MLAFPGFIPFKVKRSPPQAAGLFARFQTAGLLEEV
jgi:hypothetical protein